MRGCLTATLVMGLVAGLTLPTAAFAMRNDISIRGLGRPKDQIPGDPAVRRYRRLASELVVAMTPRVMAPAETLGLSGFEFSVTSSVAEINTTAEYWQGQPGNPVLEGVHRGRQAPRAFWVPGLHFRKGLPLSTEIGVSASYLAFSELMMLGGEFKLAIHESYYRWVPAFAVRVAGGRLLGSSDVDIVTGDFDVLASLPFGVAGTATVTPYFGYAHQIAQFNSQVIDETPYLVDATTIADQGGGASGSLYFFPTIGWKRNQFRRFFVGSRFQVTTVEFLYEYSITFMPFDNERLQSHSFKIGFDV